LLRLSEGTRVDRELARLGEGVLADLWHDHCGDVDDRSESIGRSAAVGGVEEHEATDPAVATLAVEQGEFRGGPASASSSVKTDDAASSVVRRTILGRAVGRHERAFYARFSGDQG